MTLTNNIIYKSKAFSILSRSFELDRVSGTYLFYGLEGCGRWQIAVAFAALLNCEKPIRDESLSNLYVPCGACRDCLNMFALNHEALKLIIPLPPHENKLEKAIDLTNEFVDQKREEPFKILTSASSLNIPIALAREVKKNLALKAVSNQKRVVIFYKMEKMLFSASDALLKLIEEPPPETVIILISTKPDLLSETIQSRSQKIKIDKNSESDIESYLNKKYEVSEYQIKLLAKIAGGSIGRAIEMIDLSDDEQKSQRAVVFLLFKSLFRDENPETLAHMAELLSLRDQSETEELLRLWQSLIRDCGIYAATSDESRIINIDFKQEIIKLSAYFSNSDLIPILAGEIKITLADLKRNVHIQGALMALALKIKGHIKKIA